MELNRARIGEHPAPHGAGGRIAGAGIGRHAVLDVVTYGRESERPASGTEANAAGHAVNKETLRGSAYDKPEVVSRELRLAAVAAGGLACESGALRERAELQARGAVGFAAVEVDLVDAESQANFVPQRHKIVFPDIFNDEAVEAGV